MSLTFRPLSHALGAEIQGVDLGKPLSNSEFDQIHSKFLESGILLFRNQKITREQHIAFSGRLGPLERGKSPKIKGTEVRLPYPEIVNRLAGRARDARRCRWRPLRTGL